MRPPSHPNLPRGRRLVLSAYLSLENRSSVRMPRGAFGSSRELPIISDCQNAGIYKTRATRRSKWLLDRAWPSGALEMASPACCRPSARNGCLGLPRRQSARIGRSGVPQCRQSFRKPLGPAPGPARALAMAARVCLGAAVALEMAALGLSCSQARRLRSTLQSKLLSCCSVQRNVAQLRCVVHCSCMDMH